MDRDVNITYSNFEFENNLDIVHVTSSILMEIRNTDPIEIFAFLALEIMV